MSVDHVNTMACTGFCFIRCFKRNYMFWALTILYVFIVQGTLSCQKIKEKYYLSLNWCTYRTQMVKSTVQRYKSPLVGGYNFCFDCVCTQASSPNRGYRGWSHTMTFPLRGLGVRSTEPQQETVKVLETCGCDIPQKCSHGMSYVQIFTSSMFAIKNDGITSFPFSSSCCCHWAKSHLTLWLLITFFPL